MTYRVHNNQTVTLWRINPRTGFRETLEYSGPLRNKPTGWKVAK